MAKLITLREAAEIMSCSNHSVYLYHRDGKKTSDGTGTVRLETIRPEGSRDIFTTPEFIEDFLAKTFPTRQKEKYLATLDILEDKYGLDTTQTRSDMSI